VGGTEWVPPVNWIINTDNTRQFFELIKKVTGVYTRVLRNQDERRHF